VVTAYAFRVQADCVSEGITPTMETCVGRYQVRASSPEAAATVARQLFHAELSLRHQSPVNGVTAMEILPATRESVFAMRSPD
jgi:hypothetical protein